MKKYIIAGAIALTSTFAVADTSVNVKKVNKVIKSVVEAEQTPLIPKLEVKIDERSNLDSIKKLKTGVSISATATESVWSKKATTVDVKADLKTLNSDPAATKMQLAASIGSKTESVPLYTYIATEVLKDMEEEPIEDENDQALRALLLDATKTTQLDQIPAQLERLIVIIKAELAENTPGEDSAWTELVNSLKVDTKIHNFKTKEVILKTTVEVAIDFFDTKLLISGLALEVSESGLSFNIAIAATVETEEATGVLENVKGTLSAIENANEETLASIKDMANGYVSMAESIVKGEE
ncbi:MAG: hypothetical protein V4596_02960 [Bdellovibrionota bacterium]